jgi:hypothetical protein
MPHPAGIIRIHQHLVGSERHGFEPLIVGVARRPASEQLICAEGLGQRPKQARPVAEPVNGVIDSIPATRSKLRAIANQFGASSAAPAAERRTAATSSNAGTTHAGITARATPLTVARCTDRSVDLPPGSLKPVAGEPETAASSPASASAPLSLKARAPPGTGPALGGG